MISKTADKIVSLILMLICLVLIGCVDNKTFKKATSTVSAPQPSVTTSKNTNLLSVAKGFVEVGINAQGYKEYQHEQTRMIFVLLPAGTLHMGDKEMSYEKEPVHEATIIPFLMSKYEVTQGIWQKIMNNNPAGFKKGDNYPVEQVSWEDCDAFCKKTGLRLPTEIEWEYAMRSGTNTKFYWGDKENGDYMWYGGNSGGSTHPVGQKKPNGYGLYDMSGNVWEWCADLYDSNGPTARSRALRGGGWGITCAYKPAIRVGYLSSYRGLCFGFRCAASIKQ